MSKVIIMSGNKQSFNIIDLIKYTFNSDFLYSNDITIILNKETFDFKLNYINVENKNKLRGIKSIHIKRLIFKLKNGDIKFCRSDRLNNNNFIFITGNTSYILKENANFETNVILNENTTILYKNKACRIISEAKNKYEFDLSTQIKGLPFYFQLLCDIEDQKKIIFNTIGQNDKRTLLEYYFECGYSTKISILMEQKNIIDEFINTHSKPYNSEFDFTEFSSLMEQKNNIDESMYKHSEPYYLGQELPRYLSKKHKTHNSRKNFRSTNNKKKIKAIRFVPGDRNSFIEIYGKSLNDAREYKESTSYLIKDKPTTAREIKSGLYKVEFGNLKNATINILNVDESLEVQEMFNEDRNIYCPKMGGEELVLNHGEILEVENSSFKLFKKAHGDYYNQEK
ncbi:MAG: hypothetical protein ACRC5R_04230 [Mycoplasmatales bacterium]